MTCEAPVEESTDSLVGVPFSLAAFKILSLIFVILIVVCLGVVVFEMIVFGTLSASCTLIPFPFPGYRSFSAILSSDMSSAPFLSLLLLRFL